MQFKRDKTQNSNKIILDKYYTDKKLAKELIEKTYDVIGVDSITEIIEPSAGNGAFSSQIKHCLAYDICPEHPDVIEQDFLKLNIPYKKGRLFIGNPPFGDRLNLARQFMKKHYIQGDYIAYILPISQLNNNYNFYEFDLIYSKNLGVMNYSERSVHCCFNIYSRPLLNKLNCRGDMYKLPNWIVIEESLINSNPKRAKEYTGIPDIRICSWGRGGVGKVLSNGERYAKELGFYIDKQHPFSGELMKFLNSFKYEDFDWAVKSSQSPNITIWRMKQHIINNFLIPNDLYEY